MTDKEYAKKKRKTIRDYRKENHLCVRCGKEDAYTDIGRTLCYECASKNKQQCAKYNSENKEEKSRKNKERINELKAKGICTHCGKRKAEVGRSLCLKCLYDYRKRAKKSYKGKELSGTCSVCKERDAMAGHKVCEVCYMKMNENLDKAREKAAEMVNNGELKATSKGYRKVEK